MPETMKLLLMVSGDQNIARLHREINYSSFYAPFTLDWPFQVKNVFPLRPSVAPAGGFVKELAQYLMITTLFLIGANLSREKLLELGFRPVLHGVILWIILASVWCTAIALNWVNCVK